MNPTPGPAPSGEHATATRISLDVLRDGDALLWSATVARHEQPPARAFFRRPWDERAVHSTAGQIRRLIAQANASGRLGPSMREELRRAGALLYDDLLSDEVRLLVRREGRGILRLGLTPGLLALPWELLHDGRDFIAERWEISRHLISDRLRVDGAPSRRSWRSVLIIADPTGDLAESYNEGVALRRMLERHSALEVSFRSTAVSRAEMRELLREFDVVHFAGHVDQSGLRLCDGHLSPTDVARLAGGRALPSVVFVNGCGAGGPESQLARAFVEAGVVHFVGPLFDVPDTLGREVAMAFYQTLLEGHRPSLALARARALVAERAGGNAVLWAPYVIYGGELDPADHRVPLGATPTHDPDVTATSGDMPEDIPLVDPIIASRSSTRLTAGQRLRHGFAFPAAQPSAPQTLLTAVLAALMLLPVVAMFSLLGSPADPQEPAPRPRSATFATAEAQSQAERSPNAAPQEPTTPARHVATYRFIVTREDQSTRPLLDGQALNPTDRLRLDVRLNDEAHLYVFRVGPERIELLDGDFRSGWAPGEPGFHTLLVAARRAAWDDPDALVAYLNDVLAYAPSNPAEWHDERAARLVTDTLTRRNAEVYSAAYESRVWD